jgi:hypothetical protein
MNPAPQLTDFDRPAFRKFKPRFRGEIWDYIKDVPMGQGYANGNAAFDIDTANYLKPVFRAIADWRIPVVAVVSAVQTLKTFACIDATSAYFIEHDPSDTIIYMGIDESARDHARSRIVPYWRSIPGVDKILKDAEKVDRGDVSTQAFYLPNMTLRIWPLNQRAAQRMTLRRVLISDGFLTKKTGLMAQAIRRTTQYQSGRKIIAESQGGDIGDDMDDFFKGTTAGYLHVVCPICGSGQPFEFYRQRPEDFVPTPPKSIPSLDHAAWIEQNAPILKSEARRWCGFRRGDENVVKTKEGLFNEAEVVKQTYYECYHCGGAWHDTPETRLELDRSSYYVASNTRALPGNVGFSWPIWAGQRLAWGGTYGMLGYLKAKQRAEKFGNREDLKQWWQKSAGRSWDEKLVQELRLSRKDVYEVSAAKHNAWRLFMLVDNQQDLMTQWVVVWAIKQNGAAKQLWRGALHGLDACRAKQLEYLDEQKRPLIKDQWVWLDGQYKPEQICRHIVEHRYGHWTNYGGERTWAAWNLMQGSRYDYFSHASEKDKTRKFIVGDPNSREYQIDGYYVEILIFPFAATAAGQRFEMDRDGQGVETLFLPRLEGEPPDDHELSHHSQIYSNKLVESKSYEPRVAKMHYVPVPSSAPDHMFHLGRMMEAVKELWKIDGVYGDQKKENVKS